VRQRTGATRLGDDHLGGAGVDTVEGVEQLDVVAVGGQLGVDAGVQVGEQGADRVEVGQDHPGEEGVVLGEAPGQRLGQGTDRDPQPAPGQLGQDPRVAFAGDQRLEHRRPGLAEDVAGHHREFDAGVFEQLCPCAASRGCGRPAGWPAGG
jgi:hypothetical protein